MWFINLEHLHISDLHMSEIVCRLLRKPIDFDVSTIGEMKVREQLDLGLITLALDSAGVPRENAIRGKQPRVL
jgi:hypothetical protein